MEPREAVPLSYYLTAAFVLRLRFSAVSNYSWCENRLLFVPHLKPRNHCWMSAAKYPDLFLLVLFRSNY